MKAKQTRVTKRGLHRSLGKGKGKGGSNGKGNGKGKCNGKLSCSYLTEVLYVNPYTEASLVQV